jgi:phosphoadenosine phosphosulfate reductase
MAPSVATPYEHQRSSTIRTLSAFLADGKRVIASSSFQTHSIPMLHMIAEVGDIPVYFLDTGFHFPETLSFRDDVAERLGLEVISLRSSVTKLAQSTPEHGFLYASDPDYCCYLNKTAPMESIAAAADVWISGVRRDQNENRASFDELMDGPHGCRRYHPMLDWNLDMIDRYIADHDLPTHPLDEQGFVSIGCAPCTRQTSEAALKPGRDGRWVGQAKTECGLHLDLVER